MVLQTAPHTSADCGEQAGKFTRICVLSTGTVATLFLKEICVVDDFSTIKFGFSIISFDLSKDNFCNKTMQPLKCRNAIYGIFEYFNHENKSQYYWKHLDF